MAIRTILLDKEDILRKKSKEVTEFGPKLWQLLDDMSDTMNDADGVGLAAVQVGILKRVAVINTGDQLYELINPEIVDKLGTQTGSEGCLSSPREYGEVTRPLSVRVRALDRNGNRYVVDGDELLARALCHEIDHMDGILFKDLAGETVTIEETTSPRRKRK